jgi:hypothetical protein
VGPASVKDWLASSGHARERRDLDILHTVALASLLAWASGMRLYLVMFAIGMAGYFDYMELPKGLEVLKHPWVMGAAGFMLVMEFLADKVPAIDSAWMRSTLSSASGGGAARRGSHRRLAFRLTVAAGLLGGTITAGTHFTKAGGRAVINTSPEPVSNWGASFTEDASCSRHLARPHASLVFLSCCCFSS